LGDSLFWKCIRAYYKTYYGSNASTTDLEKVFEKVSHQNLQTFFKEWLFTAGQPMLNIDWSYNKSKKSVSVEIEQTQSNVFEFPLQINFTDGNKNVIKTIDIKGKTEETVFSLPFEPKQIIVDPNVNLLFGLQQTKKY
jgi:aminopeptidase N